MSRIDDRIQKGAEMSIHVTDFRWKKGKNDLEYIALLKKNLDVTQGQLQKCSKVAREQYNKGKADALKEIVVKEEFVRADERRKCAEELKEAMAKSPFADDSYTAAKKWVANQMKEGVKNGHANT